MLCFFWREKNLCTHFFTLVTSIDLNNEKREGPGSLALGTRLTCTWTSDDDFFLIMILIIMHFNNAFYKYFIHIHAIMHFNNEVDMYLDE